MASPLDVPAAPPLGGERLVLEPLRVEHAEEMAPLLGDPALHVFVGGQPPTLARLRARYEQQVLGRSGDNEQAWLNWVLRRRADRRAVGYVQATVAVQDGALVAHLAWVVAPAHQGDGLAREAAAVMATWLRARVDRLVADVHPDHAASQAVARWVGMAPTGQVVDGEERWATPTSRLDR